MTRWIILIGALLLGLWLLGGAAMNAWLTATPSASQNMSDYQRSFWLFLIGGVVAIASGVTWFVRKRPRD